MFFYFSCFDILYLILCRAFNITDCIDKFGKRLSLHVIVSFDHILISYHHSCPHSPSASLLSTFRYTIGQVIGDLFLAAKASCVAGSSILSALVPPRTMGIPGQWCITVYFIW